MDNKVDDFVEVCCSAEDEEPGVSGEMNTQSTIPLSEQI